MGARSVSPRRLPHQHGKWIDEAGLRRGHRGAVDEVSDHGGRGLMSTAGKVLVVFIVLASLVWLLLMGCVAQLNRNGNAALQKLTQDVEKMQADLEKTQRDIA